MRRPSTEARILAFVLCVGLAAAACSPQSAARDGGDSAGPNGPPGASASPVHDAASAPSAEPPGAAASAAGTAGADAAAVLPPPPVTKHPAVVSGLAPAATDDVPPVIVLEPRKGYAFPPPSERPMMDQMATRFTPGSLVVRTGRPVDFRNDDSTLHNVRVRERGHGADDLAFNIALPQGVTYDYTFARDDAWDVRCDMHQNMYGLVVSTSSPFTAVAGQDGTYTIADILPGEYLAVAYTSRERIEKPVVLKEGQRLKLDFTSPDRR